MCGLRQKIIAIRSISIIILFFLSTILYSQESKQTEKQDPPTLKIPRAEENYSYLKDSITNPYKKGFLDELKYISFNSKKSIYLTLGGQYRARLESYTNRNYEKGDQTFYSQRLNLNANLNLSKYARVFGELYHGYTSDGEQITESDKLDIHQIFVEVRAISTDNQNLSFRFGRQELSLGSSRLIDSREGPNIRRSFDLAKVKYKINSTSLVVFYGKEVSIGFDAFDNEFNLFNSDATDPEIWGLGTQFPIKSLNGTNQLYYLGFKSKVAGFSDVFGEEKRHSIGLRRFGTIGKRLSYNTEIVYQFGDLDDNTISAFNIETDWNYKLINTKWKPTIGMKLDLSSGDKEAADGKLQSFNPLFVRPSLYSLASLNTPVNLTSFHPSITIYPFNKLSIFIEYALFYRTSENDGLYTPPRFQLRTADGISEKHIGDVVGLQIQYNMNRNITFDLKSNYFIPGDFIKRSGSSETYFYIAPTMSLKF
ncbi:alginate export family protein [uncultured Aquimarina sp.]|uniref:alginate export family protein n=1 Tax=uncultured Aquimarina sp. TaxID=575652 RepID=UPI0026132EA7|nr:alginate export family protein [uncultured Aquimarina sp.]